MLTTRKHNGHTFAVKRRTNGMLKVTVDVVVNVVRNGAPSQSSTRFGAVVEITDEQDPTGEQRARELLVLENRARAVTGLPPYRKGVGEKPSHRLLLFPHRPADGAAR